MTQELGQSGISLIKRHHLQKRFDKISSELAAAAKARAAAEQKQIADEIKKFFQENPNESVYVGVFGVDGNAKVLGPAVTSTGKALSKAIYAFSPDAEGERVAHVNYLPKEVMDRKVIDAKEWLAEVSKVIGGKVCFVFVFGN